MRYLIEHETRLSFPEPVREHQCELRLAPRDDASHRRLACTIEIEPDAPIHSHVDSFGNLVHRFSLLAPHRALRAHVRAAVETRLENPFDYAPLAAVDEPRWFEQQLREDPSLHDFVLHHSAAVPPLEGLRAAEPLPSFAPERTLLENVQEAMAWAADRFAYTPGATDVHGPLSAFVEAGRGVCQDFAHLLVAWVRGHGFAARYAMGYVGPPDATSDPAAGTPGSDAAPVQATHAWAEVLIPGAGWRGFDATTRLVADACYVPVAVGRDSRDAAPVRGTFKGDEGSDPPEVRVRVVRAAQEQQVQ